MLISQMDATVTQFFVVQTHFFGNFASLFLYARNRFTLLLALNDLFIENIGGLGMFVQVVIEMLLEEINNIVADRRAVRVGLVHQPRAELDFGLRLKLRIDNLHTDCRHNRSPDIRRIIIFAIKLPNSLGNRLPKSTLMSTALRCMLTVHK